MLGRTEVERKPATLRTSVIQLLSTQAHLYAVKPVGRSSLRGTEGRHVALDGEAATHPPAYHSRDPSSGASRFLSGVPLATMGHL